MPRPKVLGKLDRKEVRAFNKIKKLRAAYQSLESELNELSREMYAARERLISATRTLFADMIMSHKLPPGPFKIDERTHNIVKPGPEIFLKLAGEDSEDIAEEMLTDPFMVAIKTMAKDAIYETMDEMGEEGEEAEVVGHQDFYDFLESLRKEAAEEE